MSVSAAPPSRASVVRAPGRGFTIIEMLTAMAVLAISLALAAPALSGFVRNNRVRAAQSELVSSLMLARTEAARRGVPVHVEAKASAANGGLARGWRIWVDADSDGAYDDGEVVLRDVADLGSSVTITSTRGSDAASGAVFSPRGFLVPLSRVNMNVRDAAGDRAYCVRLEPAGMADIQETACPS